jgi:hypothetical protein
MSAYSGLSVWFNASIIGQPLELGGGEVLIVLQEQIATAFKCGLVLGLSLTVFYLV